jgi:hypothetical protein
LEPSLTNAYDELSKHRTECDRDFESLERYVFLKILP